MPKDQTVTERRIFESWRARACTAGLCVGTQIFFFGTGVAMPIALNSAWIAALIVLPFSALMTAICCRKGFVRGRIMSRTALILLAFTLLANAVFAAAALVSFAEQTLLEQGRALWSAAITVTAIFLCALSSSGISWLCFALRWTLPVLMLILILASMPMKVPSGLFPLLGQGGMELGFSALCMLGASSPVLMLLLPPPEIVQAGSNTPHLSAPKTGFFIRRVLTGAAAGTLILFCACVCTTYEAIGESMEWGTRLRIVASDQPHEGLPQTLLTLLQIAAVMLLSSNMLASAEQALSFALHKKGRFPSVLSILSLLMLALLLLLIACGFHIALFAAPLLIVPALLVLLLCGRKEKATP